ncbi:MAG: ABC transporter substrate-binding protein [Actinomycetota bacterium]|nr:ABC transporter substrate-binding protein [Actinomycetota bacterium]
MRRAHAVLVVASVLVAAGCGNSDSSDQSTKTKTLTIGYAFGFDVGDVGDRVALRRIERRTGLRFRFREMGGPANALAALARGDIDIANVTYGSLNSAIASGAAVHAVVPSNAVPEYLLVAGSSVRTVAGLRGKRIAHSGSGIDLESLVEPALAEAGIEPGDVKQNTILDSPQKAAALTSGRVDAATLDEISFERVRGEGTVYKELARMATYEPAAITLWVVSKAFLDSRRSLVGDLQRELLANYAFLYTPAGRRAWIAEAQDTVMAADTPALAERVYAFYRQIEVWPRRREVLTAIEHDHYLSTLQASGAVRRKVSYAEVWGLG